MYVDMRCLICVNVQFFFEETKLKFINKDTYEYIMHMNQVLGGGSVCLCYVFFAQLITLSNTRNSLQLI